MKRIAACVVCCLVVRSGLAAENWFLPYEPDERTVALFHLDGSEDEQPSAGGADVSIQFTRDAGHGPGKFGRGAVLRGPRQVLVMSKPDPVRFGNADEFTVELWCRPATNAKAGLISLATRYYLHITPGQGTGAFGYRAASFPIRYSPLSGLKIRRGQWRHVALTHDRTRTARVYVNGVLCATAQHADEGDYAKAGRSTFGAHDGWTSFFVGDLDEIRISRGVREFRPLLARRCLVSGEQVRLTLDTARLPESIGAARVRVRAGGKVVFTRRVARARLAEPLTPAESVPPRRGSLQVEFLDAAGAVVSSVTEPVAFVGTRIDACRKRLAALGPLAKSDSPRARSLALYAERVNELLDGRRVDDAESYLTAAERVGAAVRSGETRYRGRVRRLARSGKSKSDVRITMSWPAEPGRAAEALDWARRIGANELVGYSSRADAKALALWKKEGFRTAVLGSTPIHDHTWLHKRPEQRQTGFWRTDPVTAPGRSVAVKIASPSWGGQTHIDTHHKPAEHWLVRDLDDPQARPKWAYDAKKREVAIADAVKGHRYVVYFRFTNVGVGDPLHPAFRRRGLEQLGLLVKPLAGSLDTYWFDDLGFAYPGPTPQGAWDWESYTLAARPETVKQFTAETDIAFDPGWLVMPPKTIEMTPDPRYLAWMDWVRPRVAAWMAEATGVLRKHGVRAWLYWGDCHVGIEPFLGSLAAGQVNEIDKPTADPVTARALVDFPGEGVYRRLRVVWLFDHFVPRPDSAARTMRAWRQAKRGLLMRFPGALYWMPFRNVVKVNCPAVREDLTETIGEIDDEFLLLGRRLGGRRAFTHDLNVYVVNAWGRVYSWRPWGAARLWPLTDLPVNVRFISLKEIAAKGVPADAHVLVNYGQPNSAWSGGRFWEAPEVREAIAAFVRRGGGLVGMQSPSHCEAPKPHWALGELFGVAAEGLARFEPQKFDASMLADTAREAPDRQRSTARLSKTREGGTHWLSRSLPDHVLDLNAPTRVALAAPGAKTLFAAADAKGVLSPGVVAREAGRGRCVYLSAYARNHAFDRLMRRAIFWAARAEDKFDALDVAGAADVFVYAYPKVRMLALLNATPERATATLRCDVGLFSTEEGDLVRLTDVVTGERVFDGSAAELAAGAKVDLPPDAVILLRVASIPGKI